MKKVKWYNDEKIQIQNLLNKQKYLCANNPNNNEYVGPNNYLCPQLKYNNGFLENDPDSEFGVIFEIDYKYKNKKKQNINDKQILCLYCYHKKNKLNVNDTSCSMDIC